MAKKTSACELVLVAGYPAGGKTTVTKQLTDLGFKQSEFHVEITTGIPNSEPSRIDSGVMPSGFDTVEFQFAPWRLMANWFPFHPLPCLLPFPLLLRVTLLRANFRSASYF